MHICELYLSHDIRYQHASTAVAVIIRVIYKITSSSNELLKCVNEPLIVIKYASNFLQSLNISLLDKTLHTVIKDQLISYLANKLILSNYVRSLRHTLQQ